MAGNTPYQGSGDGDPHSGGNKIMKRQSHHLWKNKTSWIPRHNFANWY